MDDNVREPESRRSARRRLIKGSFSAPAVLTLASGSALAKSSSQCIANDAAAGVKPGVQTNGTTWVQVQIYTYTTGNSTSSWVRGSDLLNIATAANVTCSWITAAQYLCMIGGKAPSSNNPDYVAGNIYDNTTPTPAPPLSKLAILNGKSYAVTVDSSGNIIGVDSVIKGTGTGGAVHLSCWSSIF